jgi:hypothetical protein
VSLSPGEELTRDLEVEIASGLNYAFCVFRK